MRVTVISTVIRALGTLPKALKSGDGRVGNRTTNRDHPNYSIYINTQVSY